MSAKREEIPTGAIFTDGEVRVMKDCVFGWVVLLKDSPTAEEEAYTVDEISDELFDKVFTASQTETFPEEFRAYLRDFDKRTDRWRTRKLH